MSEYIDSLYLRTVMKNRIHYALFALISCSSPLLGWTHFFTNETNETFHVNLYYTDLLTNSHADDLFASPHVNYTYAYILPHATKFPVPVGGACIKKIRLIVKAGDGGILCGYCDIPILRNRCSGHSYTIKKINNTFTLILDK